MKKVAVFLSMLSIVSVGQAGFCQKAADGKALLYRVSGGGAAGPSYIFGTHHYAPTSMLADVPGFYAALASSQRIVGELLIDDLQSIAMAMMPHMKKPESVNYQQMLSAEDYALLDQTLRNGFGAGMDAFGNMHPAAISLSFTPLLYKMAKPDFDPTRHVSIDQHVQTDGRSRGIPVSGLETVDDQVYALFYSTPVEEQINAIVAMVKNLDYYKKTLLEMDELYAKGDLAGLYELSFDNQDDPYPISDKYAAALNKDRNDKWMEVLPGIINDGGAFVAVGALHLAGDEGLLNRLEAMGYRVEPVTY